MKARRSYNDGKSFVTSNHSFAVALGGHLLSNVFASGYLTWAYSRLILASSLHLPSSIRATPGTKFALKELRHHRRVAVLFERVRMLLCGLYRGMPHLHHRIELARRLSTLIPANWAAAGNRLPRITARGKSVALRALRCNVFTANPSAWPRRRAGRGFTGRWLNRVYYPQIHRPGRGTRCSSKPAVRSGRWLSRVWRFPRPHPAHKSTRMPAAGRTPPKYAKRTISGLETTKSPYPATPRPWATTSSQPPPFRAPNIAPAATRRPTSSGARPCIPIRFARRSTALA